MILVLQVMYLRWVVLYSVTAKSNKNSILINLNKEYLCLIL